jgi:hypothetical protein
MYDCNIWGVTSARIQVSLDSIPDVAKGLDRSPLGMMTGRQSHCLDGGIFPVLRHRPQRLAGAVKSPLDG